MVPDFHSYAFDYFTYTAEGLVIKISGSAFFENI